MKPGIRHLADLARSLLLRLFFAGFASLASPPPPHLDLPAARSSLDFHNHRRIVELRDCPLRPRVMRLGWLRLLEFPSQVASGAGNSAGNPLFRGSPKRSGRFEDALRGLFNMQKSLLDKWNSSLFSSSPLVLNDALISYLPLRLVFPFKL